MDFIKAVSIIGRDLEEALALLDQLSAIKSAQTAEIELARSRVRSASELLRLLPELDRVGPPETAKGQEPVRASETVKAQEPVKATGRLKGQEPAKPPLAVPVIEPEAAEDAMIMAQEPHEVQEPPKRETAKIHEPHKVQEPVNLSDVPAQETQKIKETHKAPETQRSILADRFASTGTFGEKMQSAKQDEAITSVMHGKHIADIATAIGMNDKFYFIRELFSGDTMAYQDTIKRLNAAASLGEAMRILDESTVMGSDPAAQSSFVDVVRRKFNLNV